MIKCYDRLSGERFRVPEDDDELESAIESYIRAGIDRDTGAVDYDVETDDGRTFSGRVSPA